VKLVKEHIYEAIKHLTPRSEEEVKKNKKQEKEIINYVLKMGGDIWDKMRDFNEEILWELQNEDVNITDDNIEIIESKIKECFDDTLEYVLFNY
jgi:dsDNA-binding SOS-regulon protein